MLHKETRYRFADESVDRERPLPEPEFVWHPRRRRFDALSVMALGVIGAFGFVFLSELFLAGGISGQIAKTMAAADQAQEVVVDLWRTPFRRIEEALAGR